MERDIIINVYWSSCKVPAIHIMKLEFSGQIFEQYSFIKLHKNPFTVGVDLFHADGQTDRRTDMTKLILTIQCVLVLLSVYDAGNQQSI